MNLKKTQYLLLIAFPLLGAYLGSMLAGAAEDSPGISLMNIALAAAFLCGILAFFQRLGQQLWQWYAAIFLALLFSMTSMLMIEAPISIFSLLMPNLLYCFISVLLIRYVFYGKYFFRLRTLLMGLFGGLMTSTYLAALYSMMGIELAENFWNTAFLFGLIVYVFIAFSMSVADLILVRGEVKELRKEDKPEDDQ